MSAVNVHRGVAESLGHDRQRHAGGELQGRRAVPQVVQPLHRQSGPGGEQPELPGHVVRAVGRPVRPREHEVADVRRQAYAPPLVRLLFAVRRQDLDGPGIEVDPTFFAAAGFWAAR